MEKVVLVTGDSSGIGRATCQRLSANGWRVFGASRRDTPDTAWTHLTMDVTDEASVKSAVASLLEQAGRIDSVVHCAGESFVAPIEEASVEEVQRHFNLNVFGTVRLLRTILPTMRAQKSGKIIVIGSIGGLIGLPYHGYYSAGKFALDGIVEAMRPEVSPFGIDASILHPGDIKTEIDQHRVATAHSDETSPYHEAYTRAVAFYAGAEQEGNPPELVAKQVEHMLRQKHMPVRALVGKFMEKFGVFGKRMMISRHFEYMMSLTYGPSAKIK